MFRILLFIDVYLHASENFKAEVVTTHDGSKSFCLYTDEKLTALHINLSGKEINVGFKQLPLDCSKIQDKDLSFDFYVYNIRYSKTSNKTFQMQFSTESGGKLSIKIDTCVYQDTGAIEIQKINFEKILEAENAQALEKKTLSYEHFRQQSIFSELELFIIGENEQKILKIRKATEYLCYVGAIDCFKNLPTIVANGLSDIWPNETIVTLFAFHEKFSQIIGQIIKSETNRLQESITEADESFSSSSNIDNTISKTFKVDLQTLRELLTRLINYIVELKTFTLANETIKSNNGLSLIVSGYFENLRQIYKNDMDKIKVSEHIGYNKLFRSHLPMIVEKEYIEIFECFMKFLNTGAKFRNIFITYDLNQCLPSSSSENANDIEFLMNLIDTLSLLIGKIELFLKNPDEELRIINFAAVDLFNCITVSSLLNYNHQCGELVGLIKCPCNISFLTDNNIEHENKKLVIENLNEFEKEFKLNEEEIESFIHKNPSLKTEKLLKTADIWQNYHKNNMNKQNTQD